MNLTATEAGSSDLSFAIQTLAECELVRLHGVELQARMRRKLEHVGAQLQVDSSQQDHR